MQNKPKPFRNPDWFSTCDYFQFKVSTEGTGIVMRASRDNDESRKWEDLHAHNLSHEECEQLQEMLTGYLEWYENRYQKCDDQLIDEDGIWHCQRRLNHFGPHFYE